MQPCCQQALLPSGPSILLRDGCEVGVDVCFRETVEANLGLRDNSHFDVCWLEVHTHHSLKATNGLLDRLGFWQRHLLLQDLLQGIHSLLVLSTCSRSFVSMKHARRIDLEERRPCLVVDGAKHCAH